MKKFKLAAILGLVLLISGTCLLIGLARSRDVNASILRPPVQTTVTKQQTAIIQGEPVELIIPSLELDLKVIQGVYDKNSQTWTLSNDKAQYATITPQPNNAEGDTFLYGHALQNVFGTLHTLKPSSLAIVKTDNNHIFYYILNSVKTTNQLDDSVFNYRGKPILTIQTCSGLLWQDRQFYVFDLERAI
ncbi:MAG TPA: sortase [Patescibacteria group bacterium]|nr:sortase [Patescibacteria group bacterium]